jgi:hypothetical protein
MKKIHSDSPGQRYYQSQKEKGLCVQCGSGITTPEAARCERCRNLAKTKALYRRCKNYKLSEQEYQQYLVTQEGKCAICHVFMTEPCIDHNHITKRVRQLLCRKCNTSLGLMNENEVSLENMIAYIRKHKNV